MQKNEIKKKKEIEILSQYTIKHCALFPVRKVRHISILYIGIQYGNRFIF
jgi:hypothetical protein